MSQVFAAVSPTGAIRFESISQREEDVQINGSDARYGGWRAMPLKMRLFKGDMSALRHAGQDQWSTHSVAWIWRNEDGSYWMDTLSLKEADAASWSSNRARSEAMGMKVVPVQFSCKMSPRDKSNNVHEQIAKARARGDVLAEASWERQI